MGLKLGKPSTVCSQIYLPTLSPLKIREEKNLTDKTISSHLKLQNLEALSQPSGKQLISHKGQQSEESGV